MKFVGLSSQVSSVLFQVDLGRASSFHKLSWSTPFFATRTIPAAIIRASIPAENQQFVKQNLPGCFVTSLLSNFKIGGPFFYIKSGIEFYVWRVEYYTSLESRYGFTRGQNAFSFVRHYISKVSDAIHLQEVHRSWKEKRGISVVTWADWQLTHDFISTRDLNLNSCLLRSNVFIFIHFSFLFLILSVSTPITGFLTHKLTSFVSESYINKAEEVFSQERPR